MIRLQGYVRASLNLDLSHMVLGPTTPTRRGRCTRDSGAGRRVVLVSEDPVVVEDSSPESRKPSRNFF